MRGATSGPLAASRQSSATDRPWHRRAAMSEEVWSRIEYHDGVFILTGGSSMRKWRMPHLAATAVVGLVLAGCSMESDQRRNEPMPTDGPNQVVIKVPGMT
jgi:hypothetical protein